MRPPKTQTFDIRAMISYLMSIYFPCQIKKKRSMIFLTLGSQKKKKLKTIVKGKGLMAEMCTSSHANAEDTVFTVMLKMFYYYINL